MNAREMLESFDAAQLTVEDLLRNRETFRAALKLKAAAEANDGTTPETEAFVGVQFGQMVCSHGELADFARRLERERNGLAAGVGELQSKALLYDLDAAGIAARNADAVELVELRARVRELENDAERYRWLVNADHWSYTPPPMRAVRASWLCSLAKAELDAAIDAARSKP